MPSSASKSASKAAAKRASKSAAKRASKPARKKTKAAAKGTAKAAKDSSKKPAAKGAARSKAAGKPGAKPMPKQEAGSVARLIRKRLKELERTAEELAENVDVPTDYIEDLVAGRRRPPLPGRTDLYEPMTSFLGLSRNELAACATSERETTAPKRQSPPKAPVRRKLMELCEPETAAHLEEKATRAEVADYTQRLLDITQTAVRRLLYDKMTLRLAAKSNARTYAAMRLEVLEFLDTTADSLTIDHFGKFVKPRVARWDVDLDTGVLRVVMHSQSPGEATGGRGIRSGY